MGIVHENNGQCAKCEAIFNRYPGFDQGLKAWFVSVQKKVLAFHVADAGRGHIAQELYFNKGASKAHYGQSAHNFNAAIDTFFLIDGNYSLDKKMFDVVTQYLTNKVTWYGAAGAKFYELPHFEIAHFKDYVESGALRLVEAVNVAVK